MRNFHQSIFLLFAGLIFGVAQAAEVQWIAAGGGDWNEPANWSGNAVPTASDDVAIVLPAEQSVVHSADDSIVNSLVLTGNLDLLGGSITVLALSTIDGSLTVQQGATLAADGTNAELVVNGAADIDGGNVHALNGAHISLPGATRYQGPGSLRAQGLGSVLDLSALSDIGIGAPGSTDITEAFSRAVSVYHKPLSTPEGGPALGITEAYSRAVSLYHKPDILPEDGVTLGVNEAYSRAVSVYHKLYAPPEDGPTLGVTEAYSRAISVYHKPYTLPEDELTLGVNEAFSRAVSVYHKPIMLPEDGPALGISEAFSRQVMIENVVPPP